MLTCCNATWEDSGENNMATREIIAYFLIAIIVIGAISLLIATRRRRRREREIRRGKGSYHRSRSGADSHH
ncbi:hypothetical protein CP97_00770 [Aurantiacibacter atlanticus]|uniref:Uncharacterized protein n=1 Tax=Aurantiacibacter atlanticus TaxID=1648404 RepID=A0A0H4V8G2_9SPHN|nr:hypothetical protein CP97_00770 [Aurantiacibacter atlanticus]